MSCWKAKAKFLFALSLIIIENLPRIQTKQNIYLGISPKTLDGCDFKSSGVMQYGAWFCTVLGIGNLKLNRLWYNSDLLNSDFFNWIGIFRFSASFYICVIVCIMSTLIIVPIGIRDMLDLASMRCACMRSYLCKLIVCSGSNVLIW